MESVIVDAAPQGSAILAYGKAPESRFRYLYIALALIVSLVILVTVTGFFILRNISLPAHRLITIAIIPSKLNKTIGADVISDLPSSWRAAIRSGKTTPALLGIALDAKNHPYPYAFVFGSTPATDVQSVSHESFRTLLADTTSTSMERVGLISIFSLAHDLNRAQATFLIGTNELRIFAGEGSLPASSTPEGVIHGRWINGRGELDLSSKGETNADEQSAPFVVVLGGDQNGSLIVKSAIIAQGIDIRDVRTPLQRASFSNDPLSVRATFSSPLAGNESALAKNAFGLTSVRDFSLGDGTVAQELVPSTSTESGGTVFTLGGSSSSAGDPPRSPLGPDVHRDRQGEGRDCPGNLMLRLDGPILLNTLKQVGIPESLSSAMKSVTMTESGGKALFCIGE